MAVTVRDVARLAGVSAMTVSRVVNRQPRVSEATRRRVEAAIAELGYVPNLSARALAARRTRTIGVVVPDIANPFFTLVVRGAEEVAWRAGYHVVLANTQGDPGRERDHLADMLAFRVEGLVVAPVGDVSRAPLRALVAGGVPVVLVDRSLAGVRADLVQGDSAGGARALVDHLVGLGHRRIALVTEAEGVSTARDRLRGYREALAAAGIAFRSELVERASAIDAEAAVAAALRLLALPEPPSAVFAVNNLAAVGTAEAARARGLAIPDALSLVCFDEPGYASRLDPFLTVLAQPAETFGTLALRLLLDRIGGRVEDEARTVVLPGRLVVRASSAPPPRPQAGSYGAR